MSSLNIPDPPDINDVRFDGNLREWARAVSEWMKGLRDELERADRPARNVYALTDITPTTSLDGSSSDISEVRNVLGTVIGDLVTKRILRTKGR